MATTIDQTPAFTPESLDARLSDMRDIAAAVVTIDHGDLDRDAEVMRTSMGTRRWLWVPYDSGSHLAALDPHGKRWAVTVAQQAQSAYARTFTPYLITSERVTAITWQVAAVMIEDLPDPHYAVIDADGSTIATTADWRYALAIFEGDETACGLMETTTGQTLKSKKPRVTTGE